MPWQVCGETGVAASALRHFSQSFGDSLQTLMPAYTMNTHQLMKVMKILQISLAIDFAPYSPWWLETGSQGHTHAYISFSSPPPLQPLRSALEAILLCSCLWGPAFSAGFPVTLTILIADTRKIQLDVWATRIKGQTSKSMAKQVHLWIYGHSLPLATSALLVGSVALNKALVTLAFPQHQ